MLKVMGKECFKAFENLPMTREEREQVTSSMTKKCLVNQPK